VLSAVQPESAGNVDWPLGMPTFPLNDADTLADMEKFLEQKKNRDAVVSVRP